jgi:hypothetical protein
MHVYIYICVCIYRFAYEIMFIRVVLFEFTFYLFPAWFIVSWVHHLAHSNLWLCMIVHLYIIHYYPIGGHCILQYIIYMHISCSQCMSILPPNVLQVQSAHQARNRREWHRPLWRKNSWQENWRAGLHVAQCASKIPKHSTESAHSIPRTCCNCRIEVTVHQQKLFEVFACCHLSRANRTGSPS